MKPPRPGTASAPRGPAPSTARPDPETARSRGRRGRLRACGGRTALALALACEPPSSFERLPPEGLCGAIVDSRAVRDGLPEGLQLRLQLDLEALGSLPVLLNSLEDPATGPCSPQRLFETAPVRVSSSLSADALSGLEFGPARLLNVVGSVQPSCGPSMLAVVSLMRDNSVELRLLSPRNNQPHAFGLFLFQHEDCEAPPGLSQAGSLGLRRAGDSR